MQVSGKDDEGKPVSCGCSCTGIALGIGAAVSLSWVFNHSVGWAIFHACLGWFYVAYKVPWYVITNF